MENESRADFFRELTGQMLKNKQVHGAVFCVENQDGSLSWTGSAGDLKDDDQYLVASVTKLYITTIMLKLRAAGKISFSDQISRYFPADLIRGLHVYNGVDYTQDITIAHLLSNTSGIPDYFYYDQPKGNAVEQLMQGKDQSWTLEQVIEKAKQAKPKFRPGQKGKVFYSDTNFQLLGGIIEQVTDQWVGDVFREVIFQPLQLKDTYAYREDADPQPVPIYYKKQKILIPNVAKYMSSITAEGGIISTAQDCMRFLKAFFNGYFFPVSTLAELMQNWNLILFPGQFYFGLGLEKLWIPRLYSLRKPIGDVLGFWGQSGAFAFHHPDSGLYFTGTINQLSGMGHGAAYRAIMKVIKSI